MTYEAFHPLPTLFASMFHSAYLQPPIELESALKNLTLYFHSQVFLVASLLKKRSRLQCLLYDIKYFGSRVDEKINMTLLSVRSVWSWELSRQV